jgi:Fibronectin type III domain/PQQ enzyme repeat
LKVSLSIFAVVAAGLWGADVPASVQVNVTQYHNHSSRDGLYVDSVFTQSAAANLTRDLKFDGTIVGGVITQPLYIDNGPGGRAMIIAVTESNNVYALDAVNGSIIWQRNVGAPVPDPFCSEVGSYGIISTPVVDLASRSLFLGAMTTPDGGTTIKQYIISLDVDTGAINAGWPVDVEAMAQYNGTSFIAAVQQQRASLAIVGNILYVGYGGRADCSNYHGWLVGVPINNPASVTAWATSATGGGVWSASGVASDGTNAFVSTGNTFQPLNWSGGEAVIRFQPGPIFSGNTSDYWVPLNWSSLDQQTLDLGSAGPLLVEVSGATPSHLVVQMGKDEYVHILNRDNLGGIAAPVAEAQVAFSYIYGGPATYRTNQGTYVAFRAGADALKTFRISATSPPGIVEGWDVNRGSGGCGSPFVTSTDGTNNMIVWVVGTGDKFGSGGDQRLHGYDGDTGAVVYGGGGANELMASTRSWSTTGIAARGRIYVAADNKVYAFHALPIAPSNLTASVLSSSQIDLSWQDNSGNEQSFQVFRTTGSHFKKIGVVGANVTSYSDLGLSPNTTYRYKVRAHNKAGNSAFSNIVSATTPP